MDVQGMDEANLAEMIEKMTPEGHIQQASALFASSLKPDGDKAHLTIVNSLIGGAQLHATLAVAKQLQARGS